MSALLTFPPFDLPVDALPDYVQAVLVLGFDGLKVRDRLLGQRQQNAFIPEFLASHEAEYKSYIRY